MMATIKKGPTIKRTGFLRGLTRFVLGRRPSVKPPPLPRARARTTPPPLPRAPGVPPPLPRARAEPPALPPALPRAVRKALPRQKPPSEVPPSIGGKIGGKRAPISAKNLEPFLGFSHLQVIRTFPVTSSWVLAIKLVMFREQPALAVTFKSGVTVLYPGTTFRTFNAMHLAASQGKFVWANLYRDSYIVI